MAWAWSPTTKGCRPTAGTVNTRGLPTTEVREEHAAGRAYTPGKDKRTPQGGSVSVCVHMCGQRGDEGSTKTGKQHTGYRQLGSGGWATSFLWDTGPAATTAADPAGPARHSLPGEHRPLCLSWEETSHSGSACQEALPTMQVRGQEEAACLALRALPGLHSPTHLGHVPRVARPPGQGSVTWGPRHSPAADEDTVSSSQAGNRGGTKSVSSTQTRTHGTNGQGSTGQVECTRACTHTHSGRSEPGAELSAGPQNRRADGEKTHTRSGELAATAEKGTSTRLLPSPSIPRV